MRISMSQQKSFSRAENLLESGCCGQGNISYNTCHDPHHVHSSSPLIGQHQPMLAFDWSELQTTNWLLPPNFAHSLCSHILLSFSTIFWHGRCWDQRTRNNFEQTATKYFSPGTTKYFPHLSQSNIFLQTMWREKCCNYLIKCWLNAFKVSTVGIQLTMRSQTSNLVANQSEKFTTTTDHWTIQLLDTTNKITTSHFKLSIN